MEIKYTVQANVVDILTDTPKATDNFLVDTNVWFWMTYSKATIYPSQQNYPSYLNKAMSAGSQIHYCGLSLAELAHLIEKMEKEIYEKVNACSIRSKEYRHNMSVQRLRVVSELENSWNQVRSMATPLSVTINDATTDAALQRFQKEYVDGYDLFILESMKKHGITNIITDDGDFATTSGIQIITGNKNVVAQAKKQQKLVRR